MPIWYDVFILQVQYVCIVPLCGFIPCSNVSYPRRFPVVYLTYPAMRRPQVVNNQLEVCAFFMSVCEQTGAFSMCV